MIQYNMFGINMMQIQIFLKCAEYSSFSKAAKSLQVTTSMVSKRITSLENSTGLILFIRDKNRVVLTPAGKELYHDLSNMVDIFVQSLENAHRVQTAMNKHIVIGLGEVTDIDQYFLPLLNGNKMYKQQLNLKVELKQDFAIIFDDLTAGNMDIGFVPRFLEEDVIAHSDLTYFIAVSSPLYAGISNANHLSNKSKIRMEDLKDNGFMMTTPNSDFGYNEWLTALCKKHGYTPKIDRYIDSGSSAFLNLNDTNVFIADKFYRAFQTKTVVLKEIENTESGLLMVWKKNCSMMTAKFVAYAKEFYKNFNLN